MKKTLAKTMNRMAKGGPKVKSRYSFDTMGKGSTFSTSDYEQSKNGYIHSLENFSPHPNDLKGIRPIDNKGVPAEGWNY